MRDWAIGMAELLIQHYEEYTDYVCEELGVNVDPEEKVVIGSWLYGTGIDGFKHMLERKSKQIVSKSIDFYSNESRITMAEDDLSRRKRVKKIRDDMYYFSDEKLKAIEDMVGEINKDEKKEK